MKKKLSVLHFLPAIIWFTLICILLFMPGGDVPSINWLDKLHFDKVVHFSLFFILILLYSIPISGSKHLSPSTKKILITTGVVCTIGFGILSEFIQRMMAMGRNFDLGDWAADSLGVLAGIYILQKLKKRFFPG